MSKPTDPVVIRVWKGDPDDVFALFPTDPADNYGQLLHQLPAHRPAQQRGLRPLHPQQPARHPPRSGPAVDRIAADRLPAPRASAGQPPPP